MTQEHNSRIQIQSMDDAHETRNLPRGRVDMARFGHGTVGRSTLQPGWVWSRDVGAAMGLDWCPTPLGDEIWDQTGGRIDAFVHSVGTAHSIHGVTAALRRHRADIITVAVEPAESPILSEGRTGAHGIEGIGIGFTPPMWDPADASELISVTTHDAEEMARRLAREEALFAGASSGANVAAALRLAERLGPAATVVTLLVDSGLKYLTTAVYRDAERGALSDTLQLMTPAELRLS